MSLPAPSIEYARLLPMLIVFGAAILGLLIEAFLRRAHRYRAQLLVSFTALLGALAATIALRGNHGTAVMGAVAIDGPAVLLQGALLLIGAASLAVIAENHLSAFTAQGASPPGSDGERRAQRAGCAQTEVFPLTMFSIGGMLLFAVSNDLLTMFIALEVFSLPLYLLCGLARHRRLLSQEASFKYFLLGAFSSAFFLYGVAMLYGYAGTLSLPAIGTSVTNADGGSITLALAGIGLLCAGLLFKIGAVPFHSWVPDVYQGAPTAVTGFMATATKLAAFGAMLRVFHVALPGLADYWRPVIAAVAAVTMVVAAVLTVTQTDVKRLLGYSSVANVGFILIGVLSAGPSAVSSTLFYLVAYAFSTLGAFTVVGLVRGTDGQEDGDLSRWVGLGRQSPLAAIALSLFLLAMAGIPLTSGFVSKFGIFEAAMSDGHWVLVGIGVLTSVIAAFAYTKVIVAMFFADSAALTPRAHAPGAPAIVAIAVAVGMTVGLGVAPQPLLDITDSTEQFAR